MPTSGTTFTDWEQVEADRHRPLLVDDDFSWSEPPSRRRRITGSVAKPERKRRVEPEYEVDSRYEPAPAYEPATAYRADPAHQSEPTVGAQPRYAAEPAPRVEGIDVERELDAAWVGRLTASSVDSYEVVPSVSAYSGEVAIEPPSRRTVVITGRGAERYSVGSRRHAEAGLAFHERSGFNPDRVAMWAVLLGIALLLGCIAH
jgi:hypothetical protein